MAARNKNRRSRRSRGGFPFRPQHRPGMFLQTVRKDHCPAVYHDFTKKDRHADTAEPTAKNRKKGG